MSSVLSFLIDQSDILSDSAFESGLDDKLVFGIAKLVEDKGESSLSSKQKVIFNKAIFPLLHRECEGLISFGDQCLGDGFIDEKTLQLCYDEDDFICGCCRDQIEITKTR